MSIKVKEKPRVEIDHDVDNLYCVTRVVEPEERKYVTQYLWITDLMFHDDIADEGWEVFNAEDPVTWGAYFVSEWQAEQALAASAGAVHDPLVFRDRYGRWYVKRREPLALSKKATQVSFLWKKDLDWHLSGFPIDMSASDILSTSVNDSPAGFNTWKDAHEVLQVYTKANRQNV